MKPGRNRRASRLNPLLCRYLEACLATPFGFHEILECQAGVGFTTKDVFSGAVLNVRQLSADLQDPLDSRASAQRVARASRSRASGALFLARRDLFEPPAPPELHNSDGERLEPRTLYFDVDSAQVAFDVLAPLAIGSTREELLEDGKFDRNGVLVEAMVPWIKRTDGKRVGLETVLMGRIRIKDRKLTVKVNSVARAKVIRALIERSLAGRVRYRRTRKQPLESVVPRMPGPPGVTIAPRSAENNELMQHPEVRAQLEAFQRRHYASWPEVPLPALNGRTPIEAVKDPDGREMVEALLNQCERDAGATQVPTNPEVFAALRLRLGLKSHKQRQFPIFPPSVPPRGVWFLWPQFAVCGRS